VVACAFAISLLKMGMWTAAWQRLEQFNLALGGGNRSPPWFAAKSRSRRAACSLFVMHKLLKDCLLR